MVISVSCLKKLWDRRDIRDTRDIWDIYEVGDEVKADGYCVGRNLLEV